MRLSRRYIAYYNRSRANGRSRPDRDPGNHRRTRPDVRAPADSHPARYVDSRRESDVVFHLRIVPDCAIEIDLHMVPEANVGGQDGSRAKDCSHPNRDVVMVEPDSRIDQGRVVRKASGYGFQCHCFANRSGARRGYRCGVWESPVRLGRCQHRPAVYLTTHLLARADKARNGGGGVFVYFGDEPRHFAGKTACSENHNFDKVFRHGASRFDDVRCVATWYSIRLFFLVWKSAVRPEPNLVLGGIARA